MEGPAFDNGGRPYGAPMKPKRKPIGLIVALSFAGILGMTVMAFLFSTLIVRYTVSQRSATDEYVYIHSRTEEITETEAFYFESDHHAVVMTPSLNVIAGYESVNDARFSVADVAFLNVNLDGHSSRLRISTHSEDTIRLYLRGGDARNYEFLRDSQTLDVTASGIPVYIFIPDRHSEAIFKDISVQGNGGPVAILGGSNGNTYLAESIDVNISGSSDIHIEDVLVSLFISVQNRSSGDIVLRNVIGDQNRTSIYSNRGNVYVLD